MAKKKLATKKKSTDILKLLIEHHKPLKRLIKVMKGDGEISQKREAFEEFAPTLLAHAKPEEQSLYEHMKGPADMREEGFEGDVEHALADQLVEQIKLTYDEDIWSARVKVLAELVEHHIKEEEEEMFPDFKKETEAEERASLGERYLQYRAKYEPAERRGGKGIARENRAQH